ncbi:MAG: hypothetical protein ACRDA8_11865, partial [Shewanella sp.]
MSGLISGSSQAGQGDAQGRDSHQRDGASISRGGYSSEINYTAGRHDKRYRHHHQSHHHSHTPWGWGLGVATLWNAQYGWGWQLRPYQSVYLGLGDGYYDGYGYRNGYYGDGYRDGYVG